MDKIDESSVVRGWYDGYFNPSISPPAITYWNSLPVIHDKIAKRYLVVFTEKQFEDLLKHEEEE